MWSGQTAVQVHPESGASWVAIRWSCSEASPRQACFTCLTWRLILSRRHGVLSHLNIHLILLCSFSARLFHFILSHSRHKADSTLLTFCLPSIWIYTLGQYVLLWLIGIYLPQFELFFCIKLVCQCCLRYLFFTFLFIDPMCSTYFVQAAPYIVLQAPLICFLSRT